MAQAEVSLSALPAELLQCVFLHLTPDSIISFQATCKRIQSIGNEPRLWRHHCEDGWTYWDSKHDIDSLLSLPVDTVDWKSIYRKRKAVDYAVQTILDDVLSTQQARNAKIKQIIGCGYDAKDELLRHIKTPKDVGDGLARSYYSEEILACIHRSIAIQQWRQLRLDGTVSLERALGSFDMFALGKWSSDFRAVSKALDRLAQQYREEHDESSPMSVREQAIALATFLRQQGFTGVEDASYKNIPNSFIGMALQSPRHEALPLVTVAIYCAVAQRLGINASLCGYPFHIYAIVEASDDLDLSGRPTNPPPSFELRDKMFMDPFRSDAETPESDLRMMLTNMGVQDWLHSNILRPASTQEMVLRAAKNIMRAVQSYDMEEALRIFPEPVLPDPQVAFYSAAWANVMLTVGMEDHGHVPDDLHRRQIVTMFTTRFQIDFPWDATLMEEYMAPLFKDLPGGEDLEDFIRVTYDVDSMPKKAVWRTQGRDVRFKVGQLFRHKRYDYEGVVTGWDPLCEAGEAWIQQMRVDKLVRGRQQGFYHVLVSDKSVRYVAEENLGPITDGPSNAMLRIAGRYFKRWSKEDKIFVSNVKDEYPDD